MEARYVIINEMYDLWVQLKRGIKDNTFENYKYMYNTFVRPSFGKKRIQTLKKSDVKIFYNYLADQRCLQASTIGAVKNRQAHNRKDRRLCACCGIISL